MSVKILKVLRLKYIVCWLYQGYDQNIYVNSCIWNLDRDWCEKHSRFFFLSLWFIFQTMSSLLFEKHISLWSTVYKQTNSATASISYDFRQRFLHHFFIQLRVALKTTLLVFVVALFIIGNHYKLIAAIVGWSSYHVWL